jgi:hypothetical protein
MIRPFLHSGTLRFRKPLACARSNRLRCRGVHSVAIPCVAAALFAALPAASQITINSKTGTVTNGSNGQAGTIDRRFAQIKPTNVPLPKTDLDARTRQEIIRVMQSEQGFAMRPFPRGHKGLTLVANGKLEPAGEGYLQMVTTEGTSAKPGDRVVLSDLKIEHSKIVFDINGGPDRKHRFLRHVEIGSGPMMNPVVQDNNEGEPMGARLTLAFHGPVPELTGSDVKALLSPLISFDVKTPVQAFTDTLPPKLKDAILNHHVMVGMSTDMVLFAKGQPDNKSREMEGQMPFEEWIYGKPPKDVEFVRINGNRVIRVEVAKMGQEPVIFTKDEVEGLMRTDGSPLEASVSTTRTVKMGDAERNPDTEAPKAPPSLRNPGEKIPSDDDTDKASGRVGVMKPVQFPKPKSDDDSAQQSDGSQPAASSPAASSPADGSPQPKPPSSGSNGASPPAATPPATAPPATDDASQPAPSKPQMLLQGGRN